MWFQRAAILLSLMFSCVVHGAETPRPIKVLSWNLHHGAGADGKIDLARIADFIRKQNADVVALQEIDNQCARSGNIDQAAELARLTGLHGAFGAAMPYDGGHYGQAILSKHPIAKTEVVRLPGSGEPRIGLVAEIRIPHGPLTFVSTHLHHRSAEDRLAQAKELFATFEKITEPIVVAGDLNAVPGSPPLVLFTEPWFHVKKQAPAATCPADHPKSEIDHFIARGLVQTQDAVVLEEAVSSDHRPIMAVLTVAKP